MAELPDLASCRQLRALLQNHMGLGLWVCKRLDDLREELDPESLEYATLCGSLLVFPPAEWAHMRIEFSDWQYDGLEAAFEGLPYGFEDILLFAGPNFSPDRWFLVLRGPMAGNVCWWTHDGDSVMTEPWATDLKAWGDRIYAESPDILGGVVRFGAEDSIDPAPEDAELFPVEYEGEAVGSTENQERER